jgi:tetratricopeptide (TPR) repeat protein
VYAYLQLARDADARRVWAEAREIKGFPPTVRAGPYALAAMPARYALERGAWGEAAKLQVQDSQFPYVQAQTHFARAIGAARGGDPAAAEADVKELERIVEAVKPKDAYWGTEVEISRLSGAAWVEFAKGNRDQALAWMRKAADMEDASEKSSVTPARMLPARELLADMLLADNKPGEALAEYERSQVREPNRYRGLFGAGQAAAQANNREKAQLYFARLAKMAGPGVRKTELPTVRQYLAKS